MKKFFVLCCGIAAMLSACKDDADGAFDFRLSLPEVSDVTPTTANVSCRAAFSFAEYQGITQGFAYGPEEQAAGDFVLLTETETDGNRLSGRLTGLEPATRYRVYAYVEVGSSRFMSEMAGFETASVGDEPLLEITSLTTLSVPAVPGDYTITYTLTNPGEERWAEATSTADWIGDFDNTDAGEIGFTVDGNPGGERSAVITVTYPGASSRTVTVRQAAAQENPSAPEVVTTLTPENGSWPKSYQKTNVSVDENDYFVSDVADFGNGIQFKKRSGSLSNIDDMGAVRRIEVTFAGDTPSREMTLFLGATPQAATESLSPVKEGDLYVFDCTGYSYNYFMLNSGDGACFVSSIEITCGGEGGDGPAPVEQPVFGEPGYSELTPNSATVTCSFTYAGTGTVSDAWFVYAGADGEERRIDLESAAPGTKSARLAGLAPSSRYTFRLCVAVDGKTWSSAAGTLLTHDESGRPSAGVRYTGWAELPTEAGDKINSEYFYAYHLCPDYPSGKVKARNFSTCYSKSLRCPVWVAAPLHDCYTGGVNRTDAYRNDPNIACTQAGKWSGYTRGHMLGSNERRVTTNVNRDVFYYSNIGPQLKTYFNTGGGQWNTAEDWVDKQWRNLSDTCYQIVGTYWENRDKVVAGTTIPTHYYTVLLKAKKSARKKWVVNCSADELQCIAILVRHKTYSKGEVVKPAQFQAKGIFKSVAEIERMTGHTFFPNVPNAPKDTYNPSDWNF